MFPPSSRSPPKELLGKKKSIEDNELSFVQPFQKERRHCSSLRERKIEIQAKVHAGSVTINTEPHLDYVTVVPGIEDLKDSLAIINCSAFTLSRCGLP
jgi:hypothetical protein